MICFSYYTLRVNLVCSSTTIYHYQQNHTRNICWLQYSEEYLTVVFETIVNAHFATFFFFL